MKLIPSPNIYKNDQCLQWSEQELLFNQQAYAIKWISLQLALLGYVTAVGYAYKNHKASITAASILICGAASFISICMDRVGAIAGIIVDAVADYVIDAIIVDADDVMRFLRIEPSKELINGHCRAYAKIKLYSPFYEETMGATAAVAVITIAASTYYCASHFFAKKPALQNNLKSRQTQLEELGFEPHDPELNNIKKYR